MINILWALKFLSSSVWWYSVMAEFRNHCILVNITLPSGICWVFMNTCSKLHLLKLQQFLKHFHFEIIVGLEEFAKMVEKSFHPIFNCNILYNYRTSKPGNWLFILTFYYLYAWISSVCASMQLYHMNKNTQLSQPKYRTVELP